MAGPTFGVDEAGKGPALGSMFAAAVVAEPTALPDGVDDSKRLAAARREELAARIRGADDVAVGLAEIPVERIDDPGTDMNGLTVTAHAEALADALQAASGVEKLAGADGVDGVTGVEGPTGVDGLAGYVDAGERDAARFGARVASRVAADVEVRAEHGADATYPVVGAASVVAKVERDAHVARLAEEYGEVGSGYPSDETTRTFIREHVRATGDLPACARSSWATCRDALAAAEQSGLDEF